MSDATLLRWLELVQRQLGAVDARIEIGGRPPEAATLVWTELPLGRRIVVVFDEPAQDVDAKRRRLDALVESFSDVARSEAPALHAPAGSSARVELNEALARLAARADAIQAIVIDATSPVLWGTSHERPAIAVDAVTVQRRAELFSRAEAAGLAADEWLAERAAGARLSELDPAAAAAARGLAEEFSSLLRHAPSTQPLDWRRLMRVTRAVAACRQRVAAAEGGSTTLRPGGPGERDPVRWLGRSFATIYVLLLAFDGPVSELHAEGAMIQSLPTIEKLVLSLPPVDPPRPGGRVIRLKR